MQVYGWEQSVVNVAKTWPQFGPFYDLFSWISNVRILGSLLIILVFITTWRRGKKHMQTAFIGCAGALVACEVIARRIIKPWIARPRPQYVGIQCHAVHCYGFVSNHTTTIFAFAMFLTMLDRRNGYWIFPLALLVSFSRIYVGAHYPLDVICGGILGVLIGFAVRKIQLIFSKQSVQCSGGGAPQS